MKVLLKHHSPERARLIAKEVLVEMGKEALPQNDLVSLFAACEVLGEKIEQKKVDLVASSFKNPGVVCLNVYNGDAHYSHLRTLGIGKNHRLAEGLISLAKKVVAE